MSRAQRKQTKASFGRNLRSDHHPSQSPPPAAAPSTRNSQSASRNSRRSGSHDDVPSRGRWPRRGRRSHTFRLSSCFLVVLWTSRKILITCWTVPANLLCQCSLSEPLTQWLYIDSLIRSRHCLLNILAPGWRSRPISTGGIHASSCTQSSSCRHASPLQTLRTAFIIFAVLTVSMLLGAGQLWAQCGA